MSILGAASKVFSEAGLHVRTKFQSMSEGELLRWIPLDLDGGGLELLEG